MNYTYLFQLFEKNKNPLVEGWKEIENGLFTEILLLEGIPLDSTVTDRAEYSQNIIREGKCSLHENRLLICLDDKISPDTVKSLNFSEGNTFICLDNAINDEEKSRLSDKGLIKTI